MRGMISGIKRMEIHDGDGLRTTVFFKGCPLKCIWCHNPESISFSEQVALFRSKCLGCGACRGERNSKAAEGCPADAILVYGREYGLSELVDEILLDEPFFKNGRGGVTLSGGECLAQGEFAVALAKALHDRGISVYVDTSGYARREIFEEIMPYTDMFLYDIKAVDPERHKIYTGKDNRLILDNLRFLSEAGCNIEIRYPLVCGYNDGECEKIGELLQGLGNIKRVKVLKYHAFASSRYEALSMTDTLPRVETTPADVERAVEILKSFGLEVINGFTDQ